MKKITKLIQEIKNNPAKQKTATIAGIILGIFILITGIYQTIYNYTGHDFYRYKRTKDKEMFCAGATMQFVLMQNINKQILKLSARSVQQVMQYETQGENLKYNNSATVKLILNHRLNGRKNFTHHEAAVMTAGVLFHKPIYDKLDKNNLCWQYVHQIPNIVQKNEKIYGIANPYGYMQSINELDTNNELTPEEKEKCLRIHLKALKKFEEFESECTSIFDNVMKEIETKINEAKMQEYNEQQSQGEQKRQAKLKKTTKHNCFAYYAPHGGFWNELCFETRKECEATRQEYSGTNRPHCYDVNYVQAYCINDILAGYTREADELESTTYDVTTEVCTKELSQCESMKKYLRSGSKSKCTKKIVADAEGEESFMTPQETIQKIIDRNQRRNTNECSDYLHAPNQEQAFNEQGLDWNRTKKWGAFVDQDGVLRANKPSCREIKKDSDEYKKYKRK